MRKIHMDNNRHVCDASSANCKVQYLYMVRGAGRYPQPPRYGRGGILPSDPSTPRPSASRQEAKRKALEQGRRSDRDPSTRRLSNCGGSILSSRDSDSKDRAPLSSRRLSNCAMMSLNQDQEQDHRAKKSKVRYQPSPFSSRYSHEQENFSPRVGGARFTSCSDVSHDEQLNPEHRDSMEDEWQALDGFNGDPSQGFFGVYDGHGGREIVEYVKKNLERNVKCELNTPNGRSIEQKLISAYLKTDTQSAQAGIQRSGSTAATCLLRREGSRRMVYAANCGDARAVICNNRKAVRLTHDHKPTDPAEKRRIDRAGGFVEAGRVVGILAVARSFGDHTIGTYMSNRGADSDGRRKLITAEPFTSVFEVESVRTNPFLIVACDGLWDVMEDQEAIDLVLSAIQNVDSHRESSARLLTQEALRRGSTDNITCVVVFL